jgi:hypothetical protein
VDAVTPNLLTFLRAAHAEAERLANGAAQHCGALVAGEASRDGHWTPPYDGSDWASDADHVYVSDPRAGQPKKVPIADFGYSAFGLTGHIQNNSPAAVLRRIAAERKLIADLLAERHFVNDGDCWYTCRAATEERDGGENCNDTERGKPCDCGRDTRVNRRLRLLAEGWGWTRATGG